MDDVMPWDWQQAHALRAMATLRARSSATRRTAHLAARPDRARAHAQQGTAVRTVLQVATAWVVNVQCECLLMNAPHGTGHGMRYSMHASMHHAMQPSACLIQ